VVAGYYIYTIYIIIKCFVGVFFSIGWISVQFDICVVWVLTKVKVCGKVGICGMVISNSLCCTWVVFTSEVG